MAVTDFDLCFLFGIFLYFTNFLAGMMGGELGPGTCHQATHPSHNHPMCFVMPPIIGIDEKIITKRDDFLLTKTIHFDSLELCQIEIIEM